MSISIAHLTKRYGSFTAVEDVSIEIPSGSVFGLLGPNGAGKTTTFKCMLGLAPASAGEVRFDGKPLVPELFEALAYVPERSALYEWMTAGDHLEMQRRAFKRYNAARAGELMQLFSLDPRKRVRAMSKGMRTGLSVVLAFSTEPQIMILDEPTSGLDPINQRAVLKLIIDASAQGATIVLSSHQIGQVERAADHIAVLKNGRIALAGAVDDLKAGSKIVEAIFESDAIAVNGLAKDARVTRLDKTGRILRVTVSSGSDQLASELASMGAQSVRIVDLNLEDIFLNAVDSGMQTAQVVESAS
jgi:ABC-2 type transport system ATP-binding protein